MSQRQLTCRQMLDFLDAYLDGDLRPATLASFEAHLRACPECVDYLHSYRQTIRLAAGAWSEAERVPAGVPPSLIQGILAATQKT